MKKRQSLFKQMTKGIPNPKIQLRQGSPSVLFHFWVMPLTELKIEGETLLQTEHLMKKHNNELERLRKRKFKTYSLFAKGKR